MFLSRVLGAATGGYLEGPGGRNMNNTRMQGMTVKTLKHHVALQPLFIIMGAGICMVTAMCIRMARKASDTNIVKDKEVDYAVNQYRDRAYKILNPGNKDHSTPSPIPNYRN